MVSSNPNRTGARYYDAGTFKFPYTNILRHVSNEHAHPNDVIAELVDNGRDADASVIYVEITPEFIYVTDDGKGMIPWIREDDHDKFDMFFASIENGEIPIEPRKVIEQISMMSLEWMAVNVAFSGKQHIDTKQRGEKGVGTQSARSLGDFVVRTRPRVDIAYEYWGESDFASAPPVFEYRAPTMAQLDTYDVQPDIRVFDEPIVDPYGQVLVQGTQVVIRNLKVGVTKSLKPKTLVDQLHYRFGNDVAQGRKIIVIDNLTDEARRKGGLTLKVPPARYKGASVFSGDLFLADRTIVCHAEIYYTPGTNPRGVMIRRKGTDLKEIMVLPELRKQPFNSGNLVGYIEYPDDAPMDSKKTEPLIGPLREEWTQAILAIVPEIRRKIEELESRTQNAKLNEISKQVSEAMLEALSKMEDFAPVTVQGDKTTTTKPKGPVVHRDPAYVERRLLVRVEDAFHRPISGVELIRTSSDGEVFRKTTQASGRVSFGKDLLIDYPDGKFRIEIIVPNGMTSRDSVTVQDVVLTSAVPGQRLIFGLNTDRPGPTPMNLRGISIHATENLGVIYSAVRLKNYGAIEIDRDMGEYGEAVRTVNVDRIAELTALYVACAVVEAAYNDGVEYPLRAPEQLVKAAELASVALRIFRERFGRQQK